MSNRRTRQPSTRTQQMVSNPNYFRDAQERARREVVEERRTLPRRRLA